MACGRYQLLPCALRLVRLRRPPSKCEQLLAEARYDGALRRYQVASLPRLVTTAKVPDMAAQLQGTAVCYKDTFGLRLGQNKMSHCRLPS
jgi:hypothetical protein